MRVALIVVIGGGIVFALAACGGSTESTPQSIAEDYIQRNEGYDVRCTSIGTRVDRQIWRCVGGKRDECWSLRKIGSAGINWGKPSGGKDLLKGCPPPTAKRENTTAVSPEPKPNTALPETETGEASWPPAGYDSLGDVAYKWIPNNNCGYSRGRCWGIRVASRDGCPNGLYAEVNIVNGSEVLDDANDSLGSLRPGYVAKLDFFTFREDPNLDAELTKLRCY